MPPAQRPFVGLIAHEPTDVGRRSFTHEPSRGYLLSTSVVLAVAETLGVDPSTIQPPLAEVVDPDALDRCFEHARAGGDLGGFELRFRLAGCRVRVRGDGHIAVERRAVGGVMPPDASTEDGTRKDGSVDAGGRPDASTDDAATP